MLRGNFYAKIDDKGRLKIPTAFRALIAEKYGESVYVTSVTGGSVRIYPMPVWVGIEEKLAQVPSTHPSRLRFFDRVLVFRLVFFKTVCNKCWLMFLKILSSSGGRTTFIK